MILVLGGAKSGKTAWAESFAARRAAETGGQVIYLASAVAWDDEMKLRIKRHRESRPREWMTIEEPLHVARKIDECCPGNGKIVLFDCLTLWLTNLLMGLGENFRQEEAEELVKTELDGLLRSIENFNGEVIVVSNLVETGLVAPNFLGRIFQEIAGRSHQALARASRQVVMITAGLPQWLKNE